MLTRTLLAIGGLVTGIAAAAEPPAPPSAAELVATHLHEFEYSSRTLAGPGAQFLRNATARSQFVLLGEDHMDHATPVFAGALFGMLHADHGFRFLVVEQDPLAIEDALTPPARGDLDAIGRLAGRWTSLYEFDSDEDLALLAMVGALEPTGPAIWGVEQTTGASRTLSELVEQAPDPAAREAAAALLATVERLDPGPSYTLNWLGGPDAEAQIAALAATYRAPPGSRAARLLQSLATSAEIFGYYRRASAGEYVGLYNNTVREATMKANFLEQYRRAATGGTLPKAMFKFGGNHLYHGKNPTQAFPIGNLAHELAIANGAEAYGLYVIALGPGYRSYADYPDWMRPLLPASEPKVPTLVDLRSLRRFQRVLRAGVAPDQVWEQMALLHGYDALVILPGSKPATRSVGGRAGY
jgi:hypothetical protein